jgi:hypothetical protein
MERPVPGRSNAPGLARHEEDSRHEGHGDDRDVEPEDRAPREPLQEQAADEGAEPDSDAGDGRPDADRLSALLAREHVDDDRQGRGHDHRAADAHEGAQGDELIGVLGERGEDARNAEDAEPRLQRTLAAEPIPQRAHREEHACEREQIRVDDPLQRRAGGLEVRLQTRQRDVQDRVVQSDDEQAERQHAERLPTVGVDGGAGSHRDSSQGRGTRPATRRPTAGASASQGWCQAPGTTSTRA